MTSIESRKPPVQKVWGFPLASGTKVVVKWVRGSVGEYYAGTVLKWSKSQKLYFIKASNGFTYKALSANVKPFDTSTIEGLNDWLAVAEQAPEVMLKATEVPEEEEE